MSRFWLGLALAFCALSPSAEAGNGNAYARRGEAHQEVLKLLTGGNPQAALSRFNYLGEQKFASRELLKAWPEILDPERQRSVATVLAALGDPAAEGQFASFALADDSVLRMQGAIGLGRIRSKQAAVLLPLLADPSLGVRREAAKALGTSGVKKASRPLLKAAKAEGEPEVRAAMLIAAGQTGDKAGEKELAAFLDHSSESTRFAAAQGLCLLGSQKGFEVAKKLLSSPDKYVRRQGVALFEGQKAKQAAPYLEPTLKDADKHVAAASARILYQGGDKTKLEWLVMASYLAKGDDKLTIEHELETLMLTDDQRRAILKKAGVE